VFDVSNSLLFNLLATLLLSLSLIFTVVSFWVLVILVEFVSLNFIMVSYCKNSIHLVDFYYFFTSRKSVRLVRQFYHIHYSSRCNTL
jgi:hypothetical protein